MTTNTNAALTDAVRVPLDSLHADAAYLIGRLQRGTMTASRVVEVIRERIDAAKAALTTAAAEPLRPTTLPLAITSAPERIWLDLGFNPYEEDAHFSNLHDLTWSKDNATGDGIEYVRVDLTSAPKAEPVPTDHFPDAGEMVAGAHIQQPFTLAEIKAKIASNDYSAELMLQHAMLLLEKPVAVAGPTRAQIRDVFLANGFTVKDGLYDLKEYVYDAAYALLALATTQVAPAAQGDARAPGLIAAAEHIEGMAAGYIQEHAYTEPDTGAVVFDRRDAGLEYHSTLIELADDLRGLAARSQAKEGA